MIPENTLTGEANNELNKMIEIEKTVDRKNYFIDQMTIYIVLKNFQTVNTFGGDIYNSKNHFKIS